MLTSADFLKKIENFLKKRGISASAFGFQSLGDPNFVDDMRNNGRSPNLNTINRLQEFMRNYGKPRTGANP